MVAHLPFVGLRSSSKRFAARLAALGMLLCVPVAGQASGAPPPKASPRPFWVPPTRTAVASASGDQMMASVAYGEGDRRYLVVWEDWRNDAGGLGNADVYGRWIGTDGSAHGTEFTIADGPGIQRAPAVAYVGDRRGAPGSGEEPVWADAFLVVWQDASPGSGTGQDIRGRWVLAGEPRRSEPFVLGGGQLAQAQPAAACVPDRAGADQEPQPACLVVWEDERAGDGTDVQGRIVRYDGPVGADEGFPVMLGADWDGAAAVAAGADDEWLVIWQHGVGAATQVLGQRVSADGLLVDNPSTPEDESAPDTPFEISTGPLERSPAAAYNPLDNEYLVAWTGGDPPMHVYGQRIGAEGELLGAVSTLSQRERSQHLGALVFDAHNRDYVLAWTDAFFYDLTDIYVRVVAEDATPLGIDTPIAVEPANEWDPAVACDSAGGCVVVWHDLQQSFMTGWDINLQTFRITPGYGYGWDPDGVTVDGKEPPIVVNPSQRLSVEVDYWSWAPSAAPCSSSHVVVGIDDQPAICSYQGAAPTWPSRESGQIAGVLTAPATPGRYELTAAAVCQADCESAKLAYGGAPRVPLANLRVGESYEIEPSEGWPGTQVNITGHVEPRGAGQDDEVRASALWDGGESIGNTPIYGSGEVNIYAVVPEDAAPGEHDICLRRYEVPADPLTSQTASRDIARCATFTIVEIPPEGVRGHLLAVDGTPLGGGEIQLLGPGPDDHVGTADDVLRASCTAGPDGLFELSVETGRYLLAARAPGYVPHFEELVLRVGRSVERELQLVPYAPGELPAIETVTATIDGVPEADEVGFFVSLPGEGAEVWNTFSATVQSGGAEPADKVEFQLSGDVKWDLDGSDGWTAAFDMSELQPGQQRLVVRAHSADRVGRPAEVTIDVSAPPPWFGQPWVRDSRAEWQPDTASYSFQATIPEAPRLDWEKVYNVPLLGAVRSAFRSAVDLESVIGIEGTWSSTANGVLDATLLNQSLIDESFPINIVRSVGDPYPAQYRLGPETFRLISATVPVYNGIVFSIAGIVNVGLSIDFGFDATLTVEGWLGTETIVERASVTPFASPSLGVAFWVDVLFGTVRAGVDTWASMGYSVPIVYEYHHDPRLYLGKGDLYLHVDATAWVKVRYPTWRGWKRKKWTWGPYVLIDWQAGEDVLRDRPTDPLGVEQDGSALADELFMSPAIAASDNGDLLSIWVSDRDPAPEAADPEIMWSEWTDGAWSQPRALTANEEWESDPVISFVGSETAVAAWTQAGDVPEPDPPVDESDQEAALDSMLSAQEIYVAFWDVGARSWSAPERLTTNELPDGMAAICGDPSGSHAILAWVRDSDGQLETRGDFDIWHSIWSAEHGSWSDPAPLAEDPKASETSVALAFGADDRATVVWVRDGDSEVTTNADRTLALRTWHPGSGWGEETRPEGWPSGVLSPSVVADRLGFSIIAFAALGELDSGDPAGFGTEGQLWIAYEREGDFDVEPVTAAGEPVTIAETPRLQLTEYDVLAIVYRSLKGPDATDLSGELYLITADCSAPPCSSFGAQAGEWHGPWSRPARLTADEQIDWQVAFVLDQENRAHVMGVKVPPRGGTAPEYGRAAAHDVAPASAHAHRQDLDSSGASSLYALSLPDEPDLTVDVSSISLSDPTGQMGEMVELRFPVRNGGLGVVAETSEFTVSVFAGDPTVAANLIGQETVRGPIFLNESVEVAVPWRLACDDMRFTVAVDPANRVLESNETNNVLFTDLGALPPVPVLGSTCDATAPSVALRWIEATVARVERYRVYRLEASSDGYSLVGMAQGATFTDRSVEVGKTYEYLVKAVDSCGNESLGGEPLEVGLESVEPTATKTATAPPAPPTPSGRWPIYLPYAEKH